MNSELSEELPGSNFWCRNTLCLGPGSEPTSSLVVMTESTLATILHTRLLVGFLGERAQHDWWATAFFEPSSRLFLEPVFPKTTGLAQYHGVSEAARIVHDEHLSVGSYHLFRLPEEGEQDLHGAVRREGLNGLLPIEVRERERALERLRSLAGGVSVKASGPTAVGHFSQGESDGIWKSVAAAYVTAFTTGIRIYPYLKG